jgi:DNA ligase-associated metallophosphoesterase
LSPSKPIGEDGSRGRAEHVIAVAGTHLVADPAGALYWPERGLLAIADLHLEKGSSFAARGQFLPPYDTAVTLAGLARLVAYYAPRTVVALGDNFHDGGGPSRLSAADRASLFALQRGRDWIWITGNHDPEAADGIGGCFERELQIGPLTFRHLPSGASGEIAGHLHPAARVSHRGRSVRRRCFAADGACLVMPAFGAYTGGLNVREAVFCDLFGTLAFTAHMLGEDRLYAFPVKRCAAD